MICLISHRGKLKLTTMTFNHLENLPVRGFNLNHDGIARIGENDYLGVDIVRVMCVDFHESINQAQSPSTQGTLP